MEDLRNIWQDWSFTREVGSGSHGAVFFAKCSSGRGTGVSAVKVISVPPDRSLIDAAHAQGVSDDALRRYLHKMAEDMRWELTLYRTEQIPGLVGIDDFEVIENHDYPGWTAFIRMPVCTTIAERCGEKASYGEAMRLVYGAGEVLRYCRRHGMVHGGIKPKNIMIDKNGVISLSDYAVNKCLSISGRNMFPAEKPDFGAPETENGEFTHRSDIYSLGMVGKYLLAGEAPERVLAVLDKATAENPAERFADVAEFMDALHEAEKEPEPEPEPEPIAEQEQEEAAVDDVTKEASEEIAVVIAEKTADDSVEDTADVIAQVIAEVIAEESAEEAPEESAEENAEEIAEAPSEEPEAVSEEEPEAVPEEVPAEEEPVPEAPAEESEEESAQEPSENPTELTEAEEQIIDELMQESEDEPSGDAEESASEEAPPKKKKGSAVPIVIIIALIAIAAILFFVKPWESSPRLPEEAPEETVPPEITEAQEIAETFEEAEEPDNAEAAAEAEAAEAAKEAAPPEEPEAPQEPLDYTSGGDTLVPDAEPEQESTADENGYLFPSDTELISNDELKKLDRYGTYMVLNEIYARHGKIFNTPEIQAYFEKQPWYTPETYDSTTVERCFSQTEYKNFEAILKYQREAGYRK